MELAETTKSPDPKTETTHHLTLQKAHTASRQEGLRLLLQLAADIAAGNVTFHSYTHNRHFVERVVDGVSTCEESEPGEVTILISQVPLD